MLRRAVILSLTCLNLACVLQMAVASSTKPFVIDTDMSVDDLMAILYLLQRPDVSVEAITVTGTGVAHSGPGTRNALGLLALAGDPDIPVARGRDNPLKGNHVFPEEWQVDSDNSYGVPLPSNPNPPSDQNAVEQLISVIRNSEQKVVLLTLGPLTNVAEALRIDPSIMNNLEMIYIMGGAVNVPGNMQVPGSDVDNAVAEWNIYVDPYAMAMVFESGAPVTLIPLDATNHVPMTMDFYKRLEENHTTPEADFVYQLLSLNQDFIESGFYFFWDPLAAAIASDESLATIGEYSLRVIEDEGPESGRTLAAEGGSRVRVCTAADAARFQQVFLDTLDREESE